MAEAYLINAPTRRVKPNGKRYKGRQNMKKLYGAAATAHKKRMSKVRRRRNPCNSYGPRKHPKKKYYANKKHKNWGNVKNYKRKASVRRHRRRTNPNGFRMRAFSPQRFTAQVYDAALAAATLGLVILGSEWANRQAERTFPQMGTGVPNILLKLGTASVVIWGSQMMIRQAGLRQVAIAGAAYPLFVETVAQFAPQLAAQVPSIQVAAAPLMTGPIAAPGRTLGADYDLGQVAGDTSGAGFEDLAAELEQESDFSAY